jgi:hypothetical protein
MPIRVELPDGNIAEFPDGMTNEDIERVLAQQFGAGGQEGLPTALAAPLEVMAGVNRGAAGLVDFASSLPNALLQLAGREEQIPSLVQALAPATAGDFLEEGLGRDVARSAGEVIPGALGAGGALRSAAQQLPRFGAAAEGTAPGVLREMGRATPAQDIGFGALSGAGAAAGEAAGGPLGAMVGALLAPMGAAGVASKLGREAIPIGAIAGDEGITQQGARLAAEGRISPEQAPRILEDAAQQAIQQERKRAFEEVGATPTRAQITRSADDFMEQQELSKRSSSIRGALEEQDEVLSGRATEIAEGTGGTTREAAETGYAVEDAVTKRLLAEDEAASALYQQAHEQAKGKPIVQPKNFAKALAAHADEDDSINNIIGSITGRLRRSGLLPGQQGEGLSSQGLRQDYSNMTPVEAEQKVRKVINEYYDSTNPRGRTVIKELKDALDEDVFSSVGDDFYKTARGAFSESRQGLDAIKKHKFYENKNSVVRKIVEGAIAPEDIFPRLVVGKGGKLDDVKLLKTYLNSGKGELEETGKAAWNDLRGQTILHLRDRATKALATNQQGERVFNGAEFSKAIDQIGMPKLREILSADELKAVDNIRTVGELRIPVPGTAVGEGPSAVAVNLLRENMGMLSRAALKLAEMGFQSSKVKGALSAPEEALNVELMRPPQAIGAAPLIGALEAQ